MITSLEDFDFDEWNRLFRAYIDFYKATIPETQYRRTFDRLVDPNADLYGLALRDIQDADKLYGIAHFYPHQTPWSEKQIMHFNGKFFSSLLKALMGHAVSTKSVQRSAHVQEISTLIPIYAAKRMEGI